jgi:hypothetical protein
VPVRVVRTDADESDRRRELSVERRVLVRRAVVRDLHDVDRSEVDTPPEPALRRGVEVPEEHRGEARRTPRRPGDGDDDARVVAARRIARTRPHHPPVELAEGPARTVVGPPDVDPGTDEAPDDALVRRPVGRPGDRDVDVTRDLVHGADVVAVEVGQDEQVDPVDPEQVEAGAQEGSVVAHVDQRGARPAAHEHGVTLADVARGHPPVAGQRCPHHRLRDDRGRGADHHDHPGDQQDADPQRGGDEHRGDERRTDHDGRDDPDDAHRPRHRGERQRSDSVRDRADGGRRCPGDGGEDRGARRPGRGDEARAQAEHRDDRRERLGEQVRGHGVRRQRRGQRDRQGPARDLRRDRHGQRGGDRGPAPSCEHRRQRRPQHDDPARREH